MTAGQEEERQEPALPDPAKAPAPAKAKAGKGRKVGEVMNLADPSEVIRPDGTPLTVAGGLYVLDVPGVHEVNGRRVTVK